MKVVSNKIQISSSGEDDIINITEQISNAIKESKISNGLVTVFVS
jgi:thiamine phosphate synthase YjbQ (UPF0047 family)